MSSDASDDPVEPQDYPTNTSERSVVDLTSTNATPNSSGTSAGKHSHDGGGRAKSARTLTAAQLAKKRANDREAQRAIRERTKNQIETLEKRIKELESDAPFRNMQAAYKEKERIQAENEDLRKRLATILDLVNPISTAAGSSRDTSVQIDSDALKMDLSESQNFSDPNKYPPLQSEYSQSRSSNSVSSANTRSHSLSSGINSSDRASTVDYEARQQEYLAETANAGGVLAGHSSQGVVASNASYHSSGHGAEPMITDQPNEQDQGKGGYFPPPYSQLPNNTIPSCTYDQIHLDFARANRHELALGADSKKLLGPKHPDCSALVDPRRRDALAPSRIEGLILDQLKAFTPMTNFPEKCATLRNLYTFVRWYISPTQEHYYLMPDYMRPIHTQIQVPHPLWIDHVPLPQMRFKLVSQHHNIPLDSFFVPFTGTIRVNWPPGEAVNACLARDPEDTNEMKISPVFGDHIDDMGNWTMGPEFAEAFPTLRDSCRIQEVKTRPE